MTDIDILEIDSGIRKTFEEELSKLPEYRHNLANIEASLQNETLKPLLKSTMINERDRLLSYIHDLENRVSYNFYMVESLPYVEQYKEMLSTPIKISFIGKTPKNSRKKRKIVSEYLEIAIKYVDIDLGKNNTKRICCLNCSNRKDFDIIEDNMYVCTHCYARQNIIKYSSSYNDIERVNISSKYTYDPKIHFRDCIKQYQGKQNCNIPQKVYKDLDEQFERHHLLMGDKDSPKEVRYKNITKNHVMMFLKELNYPKHYENVHLIHYMFTGIPPDDISYLEEQLLDDFDQLIDLYHKRFKNIKRKNFINTQYVLYQLLCNHRHPCKKEEFIILKTIDRKCFHDEICKTLFEELGWNHSPCY
jgi:hypothetical protein